MAVGKESIKRAASASAETGTKTKTARTARTAKAAAKAEPKAEVKTAVVTPSAEVTEKTAANSRPVQLKEELPVYLL